MKKNHYSNEQFKRNSNERKFPNFQNNYYENVYSNPNYFYQNNTFYEENPGLLQNIGNFVKKGVKNVFQGFFGNEKLSIKSENIDNIFITNNLELKLINDIAYLD